MFDAAMYTSAAMVESVRKAQRQNAAELLSRAFQICKESKVLLISINFMYVYMIPIEIICVHGF